MSGCSCGRFCTEIDEVYTGFRLAPGGAQEIFGVKADLVTYGKTVAGGNPIGVVCGPKRLMNRSDTTKPARVAYVIGTFAGAPATMGSMHSFLSWLNSPQAATDYEHMHSEVERFISGTNAALRAAGLPLAAGREHEQTACTNVQVKYTRPYSLVRAMESLPHDT